MLREIDHFIGGESYSAVELMPGYRVVVLDQRRLPTQEKYEFCTRVDEVAKIDAAIDGGALRICELTRDGADGPGIDAAAGRYFFRRKILHRVFHFVHAAQFELPDGICREAG